jgi:micrococcal nuclease
MMKIMRFQKILRNRLSTAACIFAALAVLLPQPAAAQFNWGEDWRRYPPFDPKNVMIKEVISADTVVLENDEQIKLLGITAPEPPVREKIERDQYGFVVKGAVDPRIPLDAQALDFARDLLKGQYVRLEFDHQRRDDQFHTVAYVFLKDGTLANAEILRQGFAHLRLRPPNMKYADELRKAYREARQEKRGLQGG